MTKQFYIDDLKHFARTMGFANLSTGKLTDLASRGKMKTPADLYTLTKEDLESVGIRNTKATVFFLCVGHSKKGSFPQLLTALKIKGLGERNARNLAEKFPSIDFLIRNDNICALMQVEGVAMHTAENIINYFADETNIAMLEKLREHGVTVAQTS